MKILHPCSAYIVAGGKRHHCKRLALPNETLCHRHLKRKQRDERSLVGRMRAVEKALANWATRLRKRGKK